MSKWIDKGMTFCTCITIYWTYALKIPICVYVHACDSNSAIILFLPVVFLLQFYLAFFCWEEIWPNVLHCSTVVQNAVLSPHSNYNVIALIQLSSVGKQQHSLQFYICFLLRWTIPQKPKYSFPTQSLTGLWHSRSAFAECPLLKYLLPSPHPTLHSYFWGPPLAGDHFCVIALIDVCFGDTSGQKCNVKVKEPLKPITSINEILGCDPTFQAWFLLHIPSKPVLACLPCMIQICPFWRAYNSRHCFT